MKILSTTLASLALLITPSLYAGEVYRVTDADGQVTFTDSPPANQKVETVDLPKTNIAIAPSAPPKKEGVVAVDETPYRSASIIQPLNNATIPPGQLEIVVQLALKPSLQTDHQVQLYIDGRTQGSPSATTTFTITGLDRGQHKVHAEVLDSDKARKAKTQTVIFHVKQHSSNSKARPSRSRPR